MAEESGHRNRHRESILARLYKCLHTPADGEFLELVLYAVNPRGDTRPLTQALLKKHEDLADLLDSPFPDLLRVRGAGENTALLLTLMGELSRRTLWAYPRNVKLTGPDSAFEYIKPRLEGLSGDVSFLLCLNQDFKSVRLFSAESPLTLDALCDLVRKIICVHSRIILLYHAVAGTEPVREEAEMQSVRELSRYLGRADIILLDFISCARNGYLSAARDDLFPVRDCLRDAYCPPQKRPRPRDTFPSSLSEPESHW